MRDVFSWTKGAHALKLGGELSYNKTIQDTLLNNYGVFTFNNSVTRNALADFMIGIPSAVTQDAPVTALWNSWYGAAFLQDDYRLSSRVTLNLGLRWDVQTPGTDPQNRFTTYVPGQKSTVNPTAPVGQLFYGDPGVERGVISTAWNHFSPRVGFVWDPFGDGKTVDPRRRRHVLRQHLGQRVEHDDELPAVVHAPDVHQHQPRRPRGRRAARRLAQQPLQRLRRRHAVPLQRHVHDRRRHLRRRRRTSSGRTPTRPTSAIQRQIGDLLGVGAAYVGTFNRNLPFGRDVNYPVVNATATTRRREHPGAPAEPGVRRRAAPRLGPVLELQRPAAHLRHAAVAPRQLQRLLHAQQDHDERAAAEQHHAGPGAELQPSSARNTAAPTPTSATCSA